MGDLSAWVSNLATQVPPVIQLVVAISYVTGFGLLVSAIAKFKRCAQGISMMSANESVTGPFVRLTIGAALLYFPSFIKIGSETLFGEGSAIAYMSGPSGGSALFSGVLGSVVLIFRLIGYIAFIKGLLMLSRIGSQHSQPGHTSKAFAHILGGILAINIEATYLMVLNSLQGSSVYGT